MRNFVSFLLVLALVSIGNAQGPARPERPAGPPSDRPARPNVAPGAPGAPNARPNSPTGTKPAPPVRPNAQQGPGAGSAPARPSPQQNPVRPQGPARPQAPQPPQPGAPEKPQVVPRPNPQQQQATTPSNGRRTTPGAVVPTTEAEPETTPRNRNPIPDENVEVPTLPNIAPVPTIHFPDSTEPSIILPLPPQQNPWNPRPPTGPQLPPQQNPWNPQPPATGPQLPPQQNPWNPRPPAGPQVPQVPPPPQQPWNPQPPLNGPRVGDGRPDVRCPINEDPRNPTHLPHENDCSRFYKCDHGWAVEYQCPAGQKWNSHRNFCDFASNVNCQSNIGGRPPGQWPSFPSNDRNPNPGFQHPIIIPMAPRN